MFQGLAEQHRRRVVLDGPGDQPIAEGLPLTTPTRPPTDVGDYQFDVLTSGPAGRLCRVAPESDRRHPDPAGQPGSDLGRSGGDIGRHEAEKAESAALHSETETDRGGGPKRP